MIGKYLTNLRQLQKVGDLVSHDVLLNCQGCDIIDGVAVCGDKTFYVLNRHYANVSTLNSKVSNLKKLFDEYNKIVSFEGERNITFVRNTFNDIILLPDNFDNLFEQFIKTNAKQYKELSQKFGIDKTVPFARYIFCFCNNSINYFSWAIRNMRSNNVSLYMIKHALCWAALYPQEISKLSRGTITAYNGRQAIQDLFGEMSVLRSKKRANNAISEFNTQQKHILKNTAFNDPKCIAALNKFIRLSNQKRLNFVRKVSTIDDYGEIMHQLSNVCEMHFSWSKESFLEYLSNTQSLDYKVFYEKDNVIILESKDYETVKRLAKTTNWCISKNKRYWDDYVALKHGARQFLLFNFDKKEDDEFSIIGFTTNGNDGITNAHSFTNANLLNGHTQTFFNLKQFTKMDISSIYSILDELEIPISIFDEYSGLKYEWTEENFMRELLAHVSEENICVLSSENNKICFLVTDSNFHKLFDHKYIKHFETYLFVKHDIFVFCDFTKTKKDKNCMLFSVIEKDERYEYGTSCFDVTLKSTNISFDEKLLEYNIPYDIIKRNNDSISQILSFSNNYNFKGLFECLKKDEVKDYISDYDGIEDIYYSLKDSIFQHNSLSFIENIYENGYAVTYLCGENRARDLIHAAVHELLRSYLRQAPEEVSEIPTKEDYEALFTTQSSVYHAKYVALMHLINLMICHEPNNVILRIALTASDLRYTTPISAHLMKLVIEKCDITSDTSVLYRIINFILSYKLYDLLKLCVQKFGKNPTFSKFLKDTNSNVYEMMYNTSNSN